MKSLTMLSRLFYFTTVKMKYLTNVHYAVLVLYYWKEIFDSSHYAVLLHYC